jgi:hypothetical protein
LIALDLFEIDAVAPVPDTHTASVRRQRQTCGLMQSDVMQSIVVPSPGDDLVAGSRPQNGHGRMRVITSTAS